MSKRNTTSLPDGDTSDAGTVDDAGRNKSVIINGNTLLEKDTTSPKEVHRTTLIVGNHNDDDE
jgi:hypothetical protein